MPVKVVKEPEEFRLYPAEGCCICNKPTRTWHEKNDVALCDDCSHDIEERDIPTKKEWFENHKKQNENRFVI